MEKEAATSVNEVFKPSIYTEEESLLIDRIMDTACAILASVGCPEWENSLHMKMK